MKCGKPKFMTTGLECLPKGYDLADEQVALEAARQPTTRINKAFLRRGDAGDSSLGAEGDGGWGDSHDFAMRAAVAAILE